MTGWRFALLRAGYTARILQFRKTVADGLMGKEGGLVPRRERSGQSPRPATVPKQLLHYFLIRLDLVSESCRNGLRFLAYDRYLFRCEGDFVVFGVVYTLRIFIRKPLIIC